MLTLRWRKPEPFLKLQWRGRDSQIFMATPPGQEGAIATVIGPPGPATLDSPPESILDFISNLDEGLS